MKPWTDKGMLAKTKELTIFQYKYPWTRLTEFEESCKKKNMENHKSVIRFEMYDPNCTPTN